MSESVLEAKPKPDGYLVLSNISKNHNIGNMVRSACAFGMKEVSLSDSTKKQVIVIGQPKLMLYGSHGTAHHIKIRKFGTMEEAKAWFKENNIVICGVEIVPEAEDVRTHPFRGNTAIMMGNEGSGMNEKQLEMCDHFVYIPQFSQGTASLNVNVAASIVMHHFSTWAGYEEAEREKDRAKFVVESFVTGKDRERTEEEIQLSQERRRLREERENEDIDMEGVLQD